MGFSGWAAGGPWGSINSIGLIGRPNYPTFGDRPDQQRLHMVFVKILLAQGRGDLKELSAKSVKILAQACDFERTFGALVRNFRNDFAEASCYMARFFWDDPEYDALGNPEAQI